MTTLRSVVSSTMQKLNPFRAFSALDTTEAREWLDHLLSAAVTKRADSIKIRLKDGNVRGFIRKRDVADEEVQPLDGDQLNRLLRVLRRRVWLRKCQSPDVWYSGGSYSQYVNGHVISIEVFRFLGTEKEITEPGFDLFFNYY